LTADLALPRDALQSFGWKTETRDRGFARMDADELRDGALRARATTGRVIGAFYEAYNEVGAGFVEQVYQAALAITLVDAKVRFVREPSLVVRMRGRPIGLFRPDFLADGCLIVEVKVARAIEERHRVQLLNYLRASDAEVGLLLNFGSQPMFERLIFSNSRKQIRVLPR
jgi:GxxExxY protein